MGAKNHAILMPDGKTLDNALLTQLTNLHAQLTRIMPSTLSLVRLLVVSYVLSLGAVCSWILFEAAGQRCMAISVALLIGDAQAWLPDLVNLAKNLKVGGGFEKGVDL